MGREHQNNLWKKADQDYTRLRYVKGVKGATEEPYQFGEDKTSALREEIVGDLINNNQIEGEYSVRSLQRLQVSITIIRYFAVVDSMAYLTSLFKKRRLLLTLNL